MQRIISYLTKKRGYAFQGFRRDFIENRIQQRIREKKFAKIDVYYQYLSNNKEELEKLVEELIIPVSRFFRNPVVFEAILNFVLPIILAKKRNSKEMHFRFWSAGCSTGEEPYSLAILLKELAQNENKRFIIESFATDISEKALEFAREGIYGYDSIKNTRYEWVKRYFEKKKEQFVLCPEIKEAIFFSYHDLRNKRNIVPPESIFGYFDLIFCRNVLIYYEKETQYHIMSNLLKSMSPGGYLVLGESESILPEHQKDVRKIIDCCSIYQKK